MEIVLAKRLIEATLFAAAKPMAADELHELVGEATDLDAVMDELAADYSGRGVNLEKSGKCFAFRTASDLSSMMTLVREEERKLSKPSLETLAIIAYHQPTTRGDIEDLRGVSVARGTLDILLELGWIAPQGRRDTPGRPIEWGTTPAFLDHFGLEGLDGLPGVQDLRAAGLIGDSSPQLFGVFDDEHLIEEYRDEDALEAREELRPEDEESNND